MSRCQIFPSDRSDNAVSVTLIIEHSIKVDWSLQPYEEGGRRQEVVRHDSDQLDLTRREDLDLDLDLDLWAPRTTDRTAPGPAPAAADNVDTDARCKLTLSLLRNNMRADLCSAISVKCN